MEPKIVNRYTDEILQAAMVCFEIESDKIKLLDGFESFIYEFSRDDGDFILRIGHSLRRTPELIAGEVDWINYLADGGANVARAILSKNGKLVEAIEDGHGDQFLATAFVRAPGGPFWEQQIPADFTAHYGEVLGRIHRLTKDYVPTDLAWRRFEWDAPGNLEIADWLPSSETAVLQKFQELIPYFETLPKDQDGYGLIHQDAHGGNFFVHAGQITLFDFDDCVYGWFIYDIAMVFFYELMWKVDDSTAVEKFCRAFMAGYRRENQLDPKWLESIPYFLKLREIDLYALIHRSFDMENLDDEWCLNYMNGRKEKIENEVPFIDFDWESLA
jgi:amicoumacin kinase